MKLTFSLNPERGMYEATFTSGTKNVIQLDFNQCTGRCSRLLEVSMRIDSSLPWTSVKSFVGLPDPFIFSLNIPSGVMVRLSTNETPVDAGYMT